MKEKSIIWITIISVIVIMPVLITLIIKIPLGSYAPGNVESWIGFYGSYVGAIIGGLVAYGAARIQIKNIEEKEKEFNRPFISALTTLNKIDDIKRIKPVLKFIYTNVVDNVEPLNFELRFYTLVFYGECSVIQDCKIKIVVGSNATFEKSETIECYIGIWEKDDQLIIPLLTKTLNIQSPCVKNIEIQFVTLKQEKITFIQSEFDHTQKMFFTDSKVMIRSNKTAIGRFSLIEEQKVSDKNESDIKHP